MSLRDKQKASDRLERRNSQGISRAVLRHLRMAPRKIRLVVDLIRGKNVEEALNVLAFNQKDAAIPVIKVIKSAIANAEDLKKSNVDKLYIKTVFVDEGQTWRRWLTRAMGRATRIRKRTSHITVVLGER